MVATSRRRRLGDAELARGVVGPGPGPPRGQRRRRGDQRGRGPRPAGGPGHDAGRPDDHHPRQRRAEAALPAHHRQRPGGVVPALQRARRRLRPRRPPVQGREGRRRVDRQRPEGLDQRGPARRPGHAHRPHRPRRPQAQGHQLLRHPDAPARHRRPAAGGDDGPGPVQRGLPRRRPGGRRPPHRRPRQRVGGGQHDAHERAGQPRRRRRLVGDLPRPARHRGRPPRAPRR